MAIDIDIRNTECIIFYEYKKDDKMILGDPYKFAVSIQKIKDWNIDETFFNGVLLFFINGIIYPQEIFTAALNCEIHMLQEKFKNIAFDKELFYKEKEAAFQQIYNITFPEDINLDNDYQFDITPLSFSDANCYIFAVSNNIQVRILAAELKYLKENSRHMLENAVVKETFISVQDMNEIAKALKVY